MNLLTACRPMVVMLLLAVPAGAEIDQPRVAPGPDGEPNWSDLLQRLWGLDLDRDLRNPRHSNEQCPGMFTSADPKKPVVFTPIIALGLETRTRGGWYTRNPRRSQNPPYIKLELWSYAYKQPAEEQKSLEFTSPPIEGRTEFEPGPLGELFGFWVSNDGFDDGGVFTDPIAVMAQNRRLRGQPYKAMIYPNRDLRTGRLVRDSYIIGWEYSTNDDFQDIVARVDNVRLVPGVPAVPGALVGHAEVRKLAGGFQFVEGPAWNPRENALYFSDIPAAQIIRYADGKAEPVNRASGASNGLMFDKEGLLVRCEHAGRRISRGRPEDAGQTVVERYDGKRMNSPNDLSIDALGGIYFTDPRYGRRDDLELDKEAVYYVAAGGEAVKRVVDDLVRPNGIALSPDGKWLYVVDNGADALYRYPVSGPGKLGAGSRIANVSGPDGMAVDAEGRLYVTCVGGVWVLDATGKWLGMIATPEQPANCAFGGLDGGTLFITARTALYAIETRTRGWHIHLDGPPTRPATRAP